MSARARVLFVTYGAGHVSMVVPVMQAMAERGVAEGVVLALTSAATVTRAAGLPTLQFRDFIEPGDAQALAWGEELASTLNPGGQVDPQETRAYLGLSFQDLVQEHGLERAREMYAQYGRHCFLPVPTLRRIIAKLAPDAVVITNSPRAERAAGIAARELGVPALCINSLFAIDEVEWIGQQGFCQKVCVLNDAVKDKLLKAGRSESEIIVTGNPSFDDLTSPQVCDAGDRLRASLSSDVVSIVLWASQPEPTAHPTAPGKIGDPALPERILRQLLEWAEALPSRHVLLRPHPNESLPEVVHPRATWCASPQYDIGTLLHASDLVVTMTSTVAVQAYSVGLRVVQVRGSIFDHSMPLAEFGMARECNLPGLATAIDQSFAALSSARPIAHDTRRASASIVTEILNLLSRKDGLIAQQMKCPR
jgi:hypothetical protein